MRARDHSGLVAAGLALVCALFLLGFMFAYGAGAELSDVDCPRPNGPHDEPAPGCQKFCKDSPVWFAWGHGKVCWLDDNSTFSEEGNA